MSNNGSPEVAIVTTGMGNLFSIVQACRHVGLESSITADPDVVVRADAVILPGVGAFGEAMKVLRNNGLDDAVCHAVGNGKPLFGICLGLQLLMTESSEFGRHEGLGLVPGTTKRLESVKREGRWVDKVPHVGWNTVAPPTDARNSWKESYLRDLTPGVYMYFVHSYVVSPESPDVVTGVTPFLDAPFCSAISYRNIFAVQFHPERSGPEGLKIYREFAEHVKENKEA